MSYLIKTVSLSDFKIVTYVKGKGGLMPVLLFHDVLMITALREHCDAGNGKM